MSSIQPPQSEVQKLIRSHLGSRGSSSSDLVLALPSLDEVKAAIAVGLKGQVEVRLVTGTRFKDAIAGKNKATIQSVMEFETVTLSRLTNLEVGEGGTFSFEGSVRTYGHEDFRPHNGQMIRGFQSSLYRISHNPALDVPNTYNKFGFSQGTEFEGQDR